MLHRTLWVARKQQCLRFRQMVFYLPRMETESNREKEWLRLRLPRNRRSSSLNDGISGAPIDEQVWSYQGSRTWKPNSRCPKGVNSFPSLNELLLSRFTPIAKREHEMIAASPARNKIRRGSRLLQGTTKGIQEEGEEPMRWFRIREANIDQSFRETFERHGVGTMQSNLAVGHYIIHKGEVTLIRTITPDLLLWLTEQYDRAERKETWSLTMEVAITVFVFAELIFSIIGYVKSR